jgi:hypothetical protein
MTVYIVTGWFRTDTTEWVLSVFDSREKADAFKEKQSLYDGYCIVETKVQ